MGDLNFVRALFGRTTEMMLIMPFFRTCTILSHDMELFGGERPSIMTQR